MARQLCPRTWTLLQSILRPGCHFTELPAGASLATPDNACCFIDAGGQRHVRHDGRALRLEETCLHLAVNGEGSRLVLPCDIEWFMRWPWPGA